LENPKGNLKELQSDSARQRTARKLQLGLPDDEPVAGPCGRNNKAFTRSVSFDLKAAISRAKVKFGIKLVFWI
jgi:hypothetical protein